MTTYNERLRRRTRNTFRPASKFFSKTAVPAVVDFFKKGGQGQRLGNDILNGIDRAGDVVGKISSKVGKITSNPLVIGGVSALAPELLPLLGGANALSLASKGLKQSANLGRSKNMGNAIERSKPLLDTARKAGINFA